MHLDKTPGARKMTDLHAAWMATNSTLDRGNYHPNWPPVHARFVIALHDLEKFVEHRSRAVLPEGAKWEFDGVLQIVVVDFHAEFVNVWTFAVRVTNTRSEGAHQDPFGRGALVQILKH